VTAGPVAITIGIDPTIEFGPITVAWHGLTIAVGVLDGGWRRPTRRVGAGWSPSA
jgi:hypothetical protein